MGKSCRQPARLHNSCSSFNLTAAFFKKPAVKSVYCCRLALAGLVLTRRLNKCWILLGCARAAATSQHYQSSKTLAQSGGALQPLQMPFGLAAMPTPVLPKRKSLTQQPAATIRRAVPTPTITAAKAVVPPQPAPQPSKRRRVEAGATLAATGGVQGVTNAVSLRPLVLLLLASICWGHMSACRFTSALNCRGVACFSMLHAACACSEALAGSCVAPLSAAPESLVTCTNVVLVSSSSISLFSAPVQVEQQPAVRGYAMAVKAQATASVGGVVSTVALTAAGRAPAKRQRTKTAAAAAAVVEAPSVVPDEATAPSGRGLAFCMQRCIGWRPSTHQLHQDQLQMQNVGQS